MVNGGVGCGGAKGLRMLTCRTFWSANFSIVPFEEDEKDPSVWFLDHNYVESMNEMFKKVNAREKLIGWYHSGPKLRASDLEINELFKRYTPNPLLCIIDVQPKEVGVPTDAYFAVEEVKEVSALYPGFVSDPSPTNHVFLDIQDGTTTTKTFVHTPSIIEAEEAEEIGVEHLLRDIRDVAVGSLSTRINRQLQSLQGLHARLADIGRYLQKVQDGELPVNQQILGHLQDVFNLLPNLSTPSTNAATAEDGTMVAVDSSNELARALSIKTNDQLMAVYLSSLIRAITAFHDLIENKIQNRQAHEEEKEKEREREQKEKEEKEKKEKEKEEAKKTAEEKEKEKSEKKDDTSASSGKK